jgi:2,3-bisphosphoglycerate-independent phosphoglycerate mutase
VRVLLCFIDGLGLGQPDPTTNPLVTAHMPTFRSLLGGRPLTREAVPYAAPDLHVIPTDACLGVPGLPQSATGQTTIFTGQNAAQAIGRHLNYYPTPNLKAILQAHSIFKQVADRGLRTTFLNPFPPSFFAWVEAGQPLHADRRYRPSASTLAALAGGIGSFRTLEQWQAGEAVSFDIDGSAMRVRGYYEGPVLDPAEVGRRAAQVAGANHFTLYEHFLTDKAGHSRDMTGAVCVLELLDRFVGGLLAQLPSDVTLLITSDHGNVEDLSVKTHTRNEVPTMIKGPGAAELAARIRSLTDISPAIVDYLAGQI